MPAPRWVRSYIQPIAVRDVLHYLIRAAEVAAGRQPGVRHRRARRLPLRPAHERLCGRGGAAAASDRRPAGAHAVARRPMGEPRHPDPASPRGADHRVAAVRLRHARARHRRRHPAAGRRAAAVSHRRATRARARARGRGRDQLAELPRSRALRATRCRAIPTGRATRCTSTSASGTPRHRRPTCGGSSRGSAARTAGTPSPRVGDPGLGRQAHGRRRAASGPPRSRRAARRRRRRLLAGRGDRPRQLPSVACRDAVARARLARARRRVDPDGGSRYRQRAVYFPKGLSGRLYWWAIAPFHDVIFSGMANRITAEAEAARVSTAHEMEVTKR